MADETGVSKHAKPLIARLEFGEHKLTFNLMTRRLQMGSKGHVDYYWMDESPSRQAIVDTLKDTNPSNKIDLTNVSRGGNLPDKGININYLSTLLYWYISCGESQSLLNYANLQTTLLANYYQEAYTSKSLQDVFTDAFLRHGTVKNNIKQGEGELTDDENQIIKDAANSRSFSKIQKTIDNILGWDPPSKGVVQEHQSALEDLFSEWKKLCAQGKHAGIKGFTERATTYAAKIRRRSGNDQTREFVNLLNYNSKYSYYKCYANVWHALIPWLKANQGLDKCSENFMRFWHNQNSTIFLTCGSTIEDFNGPPFDLLRPQFFLVTENTLKQKGVDLTKGIPVEHRDIFSGQILSLHPLSGFFMLDDLLMELAGRFFLTDDCDSSLGNGYLPNCQSYWDLIYGILYAAYKYKKEYLKQKTGRDKPQFKSKRRHNSF